MIFSIILIIVFLSVAFFGIKKFISFQDDMKAGKFMSDLQADVNEMWQSEQGYQTNTYDVPKKAEYFCFKEQPANSINYDAYFLPKDYEGTILEHVNWVNIIANAGDSYQQEREGICFKVENAKIGIILEKRSADQQVTIRRPRIEQE